MLLPYGFLQPYKLFEHLLVNVVHLFVQMGDFKLGLDIDVVFDIGPYLVFGRLPVLRDQNKTG